MGESLSVVVLAYGDEPHLNGCIESILANEAVTEIVIVDNGASDAIAKLPSDPAIQILSPGLNLGFAAGCNLAAETATGSTLVFVNSDVELEPTACAALQTRLQDPTVGLATASVRIADRPELMNSGGNPVQFLMFSWAGGLGDPARNHIKSQRVASVSGATFAIRRELWCALGGFNADYFVYGEDLELSLRVWLAGYDVIYEPRAISHHWYEFSRNPDKLFLLERNRLMTLFTIYEKATLWRTVPVAAVIEAAVLVAALRDGWARQKVDGWLWIWRNRTGLRERRRVVQAKRTRGDAILFKVLQAPINPPPAFGFSVPQVLNRCLSMAWDRIANRTATLPPTERIVGDADHAFASDGRGE